MGGLLKGFGYFCLIVVGGVLVGGQIMKLPVFLYFFVVDLYFFVVGLSDTAWGWIFSLLGL